MHVRRARHQAEIDYVTADGDGLLRVARGDIERFRRPGNRFEQQRAVDAYDSVVVYRGAGSSKLLQRAIADHFDTFLLEDAHRNIVDEFELLRVEGLERRVRITQRLTPELRE